MKKEHGNGRFVLIFMCLFLLFTGAHAMTEQSLTVQGIVTSEEDGQPIIGATVLVKGTSIGGVTDVNGKFALQDIPASAKLLVISYVGMRTQEVAIRQGLLKIVLRSDNQLIDEVVVTALGIKRSEKILGYAASTVKSNELSAAQSGSVMGSLSGKVAGVNISSAGGAGGSQNVIIRGVSSLTGNNQPLYIVDGVPLSNISNLGSGTSVNIDADFGNSANDINPENVESVTILKGASATALYGTRAANGVIMITTKKAGEERLQVEYNGAFTGSNVLRVMQTQDRYGQGWGSFGRNENGSWGPRLDGSIRDWGSDMLPELMYKPFSYVKDNLRNFYRNGFEMNNGVTLRYGTKNSGFIASYNNISSDGILPNKGDLYAKNSFFLKAYTNVGRWNVDASIEYSRKDITRTVGMDMELLQHAVDIDFQLNKDYNDERFNLDNYYTAYAQNPYWRIDNYKYRYQDDHTIGRIELGYQLLPGLKATGRLGADILNSRSKNESPVFSFTPGSYNDLAGATAEQGEYGEYAENNTQIDATAFLSADYRIKDFSVSGSVGWNLNVQKRDITGGSINGLEIPGYYNLKNTTGSVVPDTYREQKRLIGAFATAELGYKDYLFVNLSIRNDWSSTIPESFLYGGGNVSLLLSELFPAMKNHGVNFLKVRAAVGTTGNDAPVFRTSSWFSVYEHGATFLPIGGVNGFDLSNRLPSSELKPEISREWEFGISANFLDNRLMLDATYYNKLTRNQIVSANTAPEIGFTTATKNIGKIENKGVELFIEGVPIRTKNWKWSIGFTFTKNWNEVKELWSEGGSEVTEYPIGYWSSIRGVEFIAKKGEPIGVLRSGAVKTVKEGPFTGYEVVNNNGYLTLDENDKMELGNVQPNYTMGFTTTLSWKSLSLKVVGDYRNGGVMYSETSYISHFDGNSTQTLFNDRQPFIYPHTVKVVKVGKEEVYTENNIPVKTDQMYNAQGNYSYNPMVRAEMIIPRDYFKLRELVISWRVPSKWLARTPVREASLSFIGRNLLLITPKRNNYVDPEATNLGNDLAAMMGETTGVSSTRTFGVGVNIKF
jgi:TonB-linked SusC/RagA family outer membrane protein